MRPTGWIRLLLQRLRVLTARLRAPLQRDVIAEEIREELYFHLTMRTEEYERQGLTPKEARRQARRRFGNLAVHQDRGYDVRGGGMMETILRDIRYSVRLLIKQRGFAAVAILTLALAIGAVTAVVSVIDAALLRPLPYPDPEQLVEVNVSVPREPGGRPRNLAPSMEDVANWQASGGVFSALAVEDTVIYGGLLDAAQPQRVEVLEVTEQFLTLYGFIPLHGRDFNADDMVIGAPAVAMLGYGFWQRSFGGNPDAVGESLRIGDTTYAIVGILPSGLPDSDVVWPMRVPAELRSRRGMGFEVYGRLLPGMTLERAQERLSATLEDLPGPDDSTVRVTASVRSLLEDTTSIYTTTLLVLAGAVTFVLLLACVNVAGLQLARGTTRQPELAVRASLGAGRGRLVRQLMIESLVLATTGALLGIALAWASLDVLVANLPMSLPSSAPVNVNLTVLAASVVVTVMTAALFGLVPALRLSRAGVGTALSKAGGRHGSSLSRRGSQLLMTAEVALAVVLVVGAALMLRSFARLMWVDVGFDPGAVVTMEVVPLEPDAAIQRQYYPELLDALRLIPGIAAAGAVDHVPLAGSSTVTFVEVNGQDTGIGVRRVLPGYVEALGLRLVSGRAIGDADYAAGSNLVMINESGARELFPEGPAVGRSITMYDEAWEIAGVIGDVRHSGPLRGPGAEIFLPFRPVQERLRPGRGLTVIVRPDGDVPDLGNRLRDAAEAVGPRVLVERVRSGDEWLGDRVVTPRRRTVLLGLLGGLGLLLALVGVFGLTAYAVARRTQEIGVRMAFGARPGQVVGAIVRDSAAPVVVGLAVGMGGALLATRVIESFLFETAPTDPATFAVVAVALGVAACLAAWIPARRAVHVDPVTALRAD